MKVCSKLNTQDGQPDIISSTNHKQLVLSSYNRTAGTDVTLSCYSPYVLNGQSKVTCQADGTWDVDTMPFCGDKAMTDEGMTAETKILIGVLVAVGAFVIMVLLCIVCIVQGTAKSRRQKRSANKGYYGNKGNNADEIAYVVPPRSSAPPTYRDENLYRSDTPYRADNQYRGGETPVRRDEPLFDKNDNRYRPRSTSVDGTYSHHIDPRPQRANSVTGSLTRGMRGAEMFYIYKGDPDRNRQQGPRGDERDRPVSEINYRPERAQSDYDYKVGNLRGPPSRRVPVAVSDRGAPVGRPHRKDL
ncbi:hypothetical protein KP79_PYT23155 [Mizuhopecten yessoensis]|uniref:Sushi domain-containing protein n=2 Tax=Mizuhopecten yessoensis TaxID=6573 RepID=A0A210PQK7_MIZYE|nr:hypothetical protein KP79_PYT23155 [Mizuhopecten yessoensis]